MGGKPYVTSENSDIVQQKQEKASSDKKQNQWRLRIVGGSTPNRHDDGVYALNSLKSRILSIINRARKEGRTSFIQTIGPSVSLISKISQIPHDFFGKCQYQNIPKTHGVLFRTTLETIWDSRRTDFSKCN